MAGPFYNPQAGMGIEAAGASAVVSPVAPVRTSGADAVTAGLNLASQGVALYAQDQRYKGRYGGTRSGSPDPNVAVFAEEMNKVEQIRSEQGDLAGRLAERSVASNFAAAGVSFKDKAFKSVYESTTGRSFDVYGRDDDEYFRQKALERPEVQAAFVASKAILPPGTSTESALEWSLNEVSKQQAAAYYVNKAQSNATVAWQLGGDEDSGSSKAFKEVRSAFVTGTLGALMQRYESGQVVTPKDIADAKVEWTSLSAGPLRRPPNLSGADGDAQWNAFQEGNERINNFFTTLESASSSKTLLDTQIAILADAVNKSDGMAALEKLVTITGLLQGDSAVYDSLVAGQLGNLYEKLRQVKIPPTATPDTIVTDPPPGSGRRNYEVDPDELAKYQGMTGKEISNQIVATAGHAKVFDPSSIGNAQNQATFGKTMTGMIAALQSSNQGDFFSPAYLKENVVNPKILATLEALKKSDPDQADKLRGGLQLGYQMEKMRQLQNLSSIETGDLAKFTRFNEQTNSYELNVDEFGAGFGKDIVAFNDALGAYNNNLSEAAKDGFNKFYEGGGRVSFGRLSGDVGNPQNIISFAKLAGLTSAVKRRDAIAALDKGISDLSLNQETGQTMDQAPPPPAVEQPADQGTDEEDGRSFLQRVKEFLVSPAAAAELTPEQRAQLEAVFPQTDIPPLPEAELGSAEALETEAAKAGRLDISIKKEIRDVEGFRGKAYIPTPGDVPTIGYGFTKGVKIGDTMTKEEAEKRLSEEVNTRVEAIRKQIKDFDKFPEDVQVLMLSSWYRGSLSGSPKTKRLINEGKYEEAADEFLNNDEYKNAVARGRRGIRARMEKTAEAIKSLMPIGEDELNTDLSPVTEQVDPKTVTDEQFIEQMSKSLSETPTEKRAREAKARLDARTAYYKSLNE